jgi:hypothetical protein
VTSAVSALALTAGDPDYTTFLAAAVGAVGAVTASGITVDLSADAFADTNTGTARCRPPPSSSSCGRRRRRRARRAVTVLVDGAKGYDAWGGGSCSVNPMRRDLRGPRAGVDRLARTTAAGCRPGRST